MTANDIANTLKNAFDNGNKILICGNGGSAAMSSHFVGELLGRFKKERKALAAISLLDIATLTAIANDYGYEYVFSRQVEGLGKEGDVLVILSTSGKSRNCIKAAETAKSMGLQVIELPRDGESTASIQENQLKMIHEICGLVEANLKDT